ncbi:MAG: efflux RND transporter periplasmic adaptor subunit [Gemmatimonadales bacterium]|nr:efflux RND transporter periplasmic adaptor subunit [Gemmatimonadales bacterium]
MTSHLVLALTAGALLVAGCGEAPEETAANAPEPVVTVGPENIMVAELTELRSGPVVSGSLEPRQSATVRAEVSGSVLETHADEGARVRRGSLLAVLDDTAVRDAFLSARSQVRSAESALELARRNAERAARLEEAGAIPERDLETARLNATNAEGALADAKARLASASEQLENTRIRAPFNGVVSDRQVDAGDVVQLGAALFTVVDPESLRLEASVPADQLGRLRTGTPVEFSVNGIDRRFTGRIERINPVVDPSTRQVRIYVRIPNVEQTLAAGLFAEGRVATDTRRAVAVPVTAVDNRGTSPVLHVLKGGRVAEVEIELGVRDEAAELVEVQAGLAAGDTVLLGSAQGMTEGSRLRVLREEARR